jgi:hypothetical protein
MGKMSFLIERKIFLIMKEAIIFWINFYVQKLNVLKKLK